MNSIFAVGDFVMYIDKTKEVYPGRVLSVKKDNKYDVEIYINQEANLDAETEVVEALESQLQIKKIK